MPQSLAKIYVHLTFSTLHREPWMNDMRGIESETGWGPGLWPTMVSRTNLCCVLPALVALALAFVPPAIGAEPSPPRQSISLDGEWEFQRDKATAWKSVSVPSSMQSHEGTNFHAVGWYRKTIDPVKLPAGKRVLLHFQAAATEAEVWWNGERLGSHLGGWTPFRFDITDLIRKADPGQKNELKVRLDEKVGHNTQGFLPIIAPHFGGLWQDVSLLLVPETHIDDLRALAVGDPVSGVLHLEIPMAGTASSTITNIALRHRLRGAEAWVNQAAAVHNSNQTLHVRVPVAGWKYWSPAAPNLYEVEVSLPGESGDRWQTRAAFRSIEARGPEFRLNGQPLQIRGLLNWGFSPPLVDPNPGEAVWRSELEFARDHGFNLMKFCLWVPPRRYLELADEMGILTWMEYPTWHPDFSQKHLEPLRREFGEFFHYDRNHPSVILRSLTCETGPSADLKVIQSLYDAAHQLIPGALVEDDSSWIGWNRVHDFYDDHPYGNNHTWVETLKGFNEHILTHGIKPLVLGEAIAADTWIDREALLKHFGSERPWYAPAVLDSGAAWEARMQAWAGPAGLQQLRPDSLRYGLRMRKYQVEAYRREIPHGGYVISVIRDIPKASMGLLDYLGKPKWSAEEWAWQRDTICLLRTDADARSFRSGGRIQGSLLLSHFGPGAISKGRLMLTLEQTGRSSTQLARLGQDNIQQNPGTLARILNVDWPAPKVTEPTQLLVKAHLSTAVAEFTNQWPIWIVPESPPETLRNLQIHSSLPANLRQELFPGCPEFTGSAPVDTIVVAAHFDDSLVNLLEGGGRVLLLPDGREHSFPLSAHWFLRGAPYIPDHPLARALPRDFLLELQHFDLAADVVPNLPSLDSFDPILMLWDTHDLDMVKTHGVIFETGASSGRLLVSSARHAGTNNPAGQWVLSVLLEHLRDNYLPKHNLPPEMWSYLKAKLHAEQTNLVSRVWKFRPDPKDEGLKLGWHKPELASESDWKDIRIGASWESQGYEDLDKWAWYRLWVDIPKEWQGREVYLSFEGVDDMYELYVNGELAAKGGDLDTRKDTFSEKKSQHITRWVKPGEKNLIAVRVHDWYGAGGIFRPVTLGTLPFNPGLDLLK